jgi:hypothetical protein
LWAFGRYDLQLSDNEFWGLTLREFNALCARHKDNQDWLNYRAALICTVMANIWRASNTRAFEIKDFMPNICREIQTPEQMLANVKILNTTFGGT